MAQSLSNPPNPDIDLGLAVLDIVRPSGVPLTYTDIASVCGCSRVYIRKLEQKAIRKLQSSITDIQPYLMDD